MDKNYHSKGPYGAITRALFFQFDNSTESNWVENNGRAIVGIETAGGFGSTSLDVEAGTDPADLKATGVTLAFTAGQMNFFPPTENAYGAPYIRLKNNTAITGDVILLVKDV